MANFDRLPEKQQFPEFYLACEGLERFPIRSDRGRYLITALRSKTLYQAPNDLPLIDKAIEKALKAHIKQTRDTGEPWEIHFLQAANWAADLGLQSEISAAELLHDTDEDTEYKLKNVRIDFGNRIAAICRAVTNVHGGKTQEEANAFKLLDASTTHPQAIIVRGLEQLESAQTHYVKKKETRRRIWQRDRLFLAPILRSFGLEPQADLLENLTTYYTFSDASRDIINFIKRDNSYDEKDMASLRNDITHTLGQDIKDIQFELKLPTLNELLDSTDSAEHLSRENMVLKLEIGYGEDPSLAMTLFTRLLRKFPQAEPLSATFETLPPDASKIMGELLKTDKTYFYIKVHGRYMGVRLIPNSIYEFKRTSLLPLFQVNPQVSQLELERAREKLAYWQDAWKLRKRQQAKGLTVDEFIRFIEGESYIVVRTPKTEESPEGHSFALPLGATVYDLIAGLPIPKGRMTELMLRVNQVIIRRDGTEEKLAPYYDSLPTNVEVVIKTGEKVTFDELTLQRVATADGLRDARDVARLRIKEYPVFKEILREEGRKEIAKRYCARLDLPTQDVPLDKIAMVFVSRYKKANATGSEPTAAEEVLELKGGVIRQIVEAMELDVGLRTADENMIRNIVNELVRYRESLKPIMVRSKDRRGLGGLIGSIFDKYGVSYITQVIDHSTRPGWVSVITYVDPKDTKLIPIIEDALINEGLKIIRKKPST